jgi:hypothetical protein
VHPAVLENYLNGAMTEIFKKPVRQNKMTSAAHSLLKEERLLIHLLQKGAVPTKAAKK